MIRHFSAVVQTNYQFNVIYMFAIEICVRTIISHLTKNINYNNIFHIFHIAKLSNNNHLVQHTSNNIGYKSIQFL